MWLLVLALNTKPASQVLIITVHFLPGYAMLARYTLSSFVKAVIVTKRPNKGSRKRRRTIGLTRDSDAKDLHNIPMAVTFLFNHYIAISQKRCKIHNAGTYM